MAIIWGGKVIWEKGEEETWEALRVTMMAEAGIEEENAISMSAVFKGEPWTRFMPIRGLILE